MSQDASNSMDLSNSNTVKNLDAAFAGESMANRKYLYFAEVVSKLGFKDLSKLFKETAAQETEHAFAHFSLLHPELVVANPAALTDAQKQEIAARCLSLAIEGETYEYTTMYPNFAADAVRDRDGAAVAEFEAQAKESADHAQIFRQAAQRFGLLKHVEQFHAERYTEALQELQGETPAPRAASKNLATSRWICKKCSMIYDPAEGDPDSGIAPGTPFEAIPDNWVCPICGATKKTFEPMPEKAAA
ncbi:rubrerythrin family protein [Kamptonema formosum]|uniref:rubrerythrin family protein n=1 Tax=Kamptonema formosum TaxID=331992 RepID=UPI000348DD74